MANLFQKQNQNATDRDMLLGRFNSARMDLLIIFGLTLLNIVFLATGGSVYMLFSATIPYAIVDLGMIFCGKYPDEFYIGDWEGAQFMDEGAFAIFVIVAILITSLYLLAFLLSKNQKTGWLVFSLVLMCIDTAFMLLLYEISIDILPDLIIHGLMIYGLVRGLSALKKLKDLPEEEPTPCESTLSTDNAPNADLPDSSPLRIADIEAKSRILLEDTLFGHKVIYRRVKKTNELIIDNYVYAEYVAWAEMSHMLSANIGGHTISAGYDSMASKSYLMYDGRTVKEKVRMI